MGWIKDAKATALGREAERAAGEGRSLFVCRINNPGLGSQMSGSVAGVAEQLEAVEAAGWYVQHVSYTQDKKGGVEGYYVFRRR